MTLAHHPSIFILSNYIHLHSSQRNTVTVLNPLWGDHEPTGTRSYPSAFSQGSAGLRNVECIHPPLSLPPPLPIFGASEPQEYICKWGRQIINKISLNSAYKPKILYLKFKRLSFMVETKDPHSPSVIRMYVNYTFARRYKNDTRSPDWWITLTLWPLASRNTKHRRWSH